MDAVEFAGEKAHQNVVRISEVFCLLRASDSHPKASSGADRGESALLRIFEDISSLLQVAELIRKERAGQNPSSTGWRAAVSTRKQQSCLSCATQQMFTARIGDKRSTGCEQVDPDGICAGTRLWRAQVSVVVVCNFVFLRQWRKAMWDMRCSPICFLGSDLLFSFKLACVCHWNIGCASKQQASTAP
jgi:hypothetical protein